MKRTSLLYLLSQLLLCWSIAFSQEKTRTISVTGVGIVSVLPNRVEVGITVTSKDQKATAALEKNNTIVHQMIAILKKDGYPDSSIVTSNFQIRPQEEYVDRDEPPVQFFHATSTLKLTSGNINTIGSVIDKLIAAGGTSAATPMFSYVPLDSLRSVGYEMAVNDAKEKAENLAASFGVQIGQPMQISVDMGDVESKKYYYRVYDYDVMSLQAGVATGGSTVIMPNYVTKQVTVNVTFEISGELK